MALSANDILAVNDLRPKEIEVPEWKPKDWKEGDPIPTVFVTIMDGFARAACEAENLKPKPNKTRGLVACYSLADKDGNLLFKPDQVDNLMKKSWEALDRIVDIAMNYNGMTRESMELLKKIADSLKTSSSGLPPTSGDQSAKS